MRFFKSQVVSRDDADDYSPKIARLAADLAPARRTIAIPLWVIAAGLVVVVGALLWSALHRSVPEPATPPVSKVALPNFKNVPHLSLAYSKMGPSSATLISSFEGTDRWEGAGINPADFSVRYEGQASLLLRSVNHAPTTATLVKQLDLAQLSLMEMYVNVSEPSKVESLKVSFLSQTSRNTGFQFPLTAIGTGWVVARMPRDQFEAFGGATAATWSRIGSVRISLVARPGTEARVNVDQLRGEGPATLYAKDWSASDPQMLGVIPTAQGTGLLLRNVSGSFAGMSAVGDTKNFVLTALMSPLTAGRGGLFFRGDASNNTGFSFVIGGRGQNSWHVLRSDATGTITLKEGRVENLAFKGDESYWLRATVTGDQMNLALSRDGTTFITVASIRDATLPFGEVGLSVFDSAAYAVYNVDYQRA